MLPTDYPKWLRLTRAGQSVRARYVALQEAARCLARQNNPDGTCRPSGPLDATRGARLMRTLETAREILKTYAHWESRIMHVDVIQTAALEQGEDMALKDSGTVLNQTDSATAQTSPNNTPSSNSASPESSQGVITTTKV